ncbi:MAG: S9 family peptidase [Sphingomonas sp.]
MNRRQFLAGAALGALATGTRGWAQVAQTPPVPPVTPRHPKRVEQLGRVRVDDYAWLKPDNWKQVWRDASTLSPTIRQYLAEENDYCAAVLAPTVPLQETMLAEMKARTAPDPTPPPDYDGRWAYITRYADGAQHPRYLRGPRGGGAPTLLLDAEARARGHAYFAVENATHSPDQRLFAWAEDTSGSEKYTIQVKDIATGALMPDPPTSAYGGFVFSPDSQWLFWVWRDASSRPARLYRRLARGGADTLVYEEKDPAFLMEVLLSASRQFIFIRCWNDVTSDVRVIDGTAPTVPPVLVAPRRAGTIYDLAHWQGDFVIRTNADGAEDFKLMRTPIAHPQPAHWQPWIPHRRGHFITETHPFARHFTWIERIAGNLHVMAAGDDGTPREPVAFDEAAYEIEVQPSEYAGDTLRLTYQSPRTPERWLACDLATGQRQVLTAQQVPGGYNVDDYVVKRLHAVASDGVKVPITVFHARSIPLDGTAPLMLTGYGAYGYSFVTGFSVPRLSLVDRGWIWAVAHVRGGSEEGWSWFEQARRFKKKTSFTDFIACAETLIQSRHTAAGRIVPHGYSAGGLLVGAAENMRPDLWAGVIGQAPFVDMLNTMSDPTHPLVPLTRPVWGDPLHDPKAYDYIASYSPYDNVRPQPYPPTLATTAVSDDRVGFWEPAKWIAKLRAQSTSGAPMLLHTEMAGGHHGAAGRYDELKQWARMCAFAATVVESGLAADKRNPK